jgi:hypothetical protein
MSNPKTHDLFDFMKQISVEMSAEYDRIQKRATEDPGTAGDQGEENWAALLRDWLPRTYEVVTKGRIISQDGQTSPQIDVLVLKGAYLRRLLNKKLYLAAGVAAVFECKTTLKASHINEAVENCKKIKALYPPRTGTPYSELHTPLIYGLLAHSHSWKGEASTPEANIFSKLEESDLQHVTHPRYILDLLCVADLAAWTSIAMTFFGPSYWADWAPMAPSYCSNGSATTAHIGHVKESGQQVAQFTPIGTLIHYLSQKLAWEDSTIRQLADYYRVTNIAGSGSGSHRRWPASIYSDRVRPRVESGPLVNGEPPWDEWNAWFM